MKTLASLLGCIGIVAAVPAGLGVEKVGLPTLPTSSLLGVTKTVATLTSKLASATGTVSQILSPSSTAVPYGVSAAAWAQLKNAVGDRLQPGYPMARSCFALASNGTNGAFNAQQCTAAQNGWKVDTDIVEYFGGYLEPNWGSCQTTGAQCELSYEAPQNPAAYAPPRVCSQGSVPNYYVDVAGPSDVAAALAFSQQTGVGVTVKNSGHDYKGRSAGPNTLGIWVHNLQSGPTGHSNFVAAGCTGPGVTAVTFGAGTGFLKLYQWADANNQTVVGGSSETVVAGGGWVSAAGHSSLSNTLGLGADLALEMQVVLPNGTYVTASRCQHPDLFYALRGSGGGVFGVAMQVTMRTYPKLTLQVAYIRFASLSPSSATQFLQLCIQQALTWANHGWGGYIEPGAMSAQASGFVLVTPAINHTQAVADMAPLTAFASSLGNVALNNEVDTVEGFYNFYNTYLVPNEEAVGVNAALASRLIPKSIYATASGRASLLKAFTQAAATVGSNILSPNAPTLAYGGAPVQILVTCPSSYKTDGTSSVQPLWYSSVWHVILAPTFNYLSTPAQVASAWAKANQAAEYLRDITPPAAYQNEASINEPNYQQSFWGTTNYNRLSQMKPEYDPHNLLTCHQCIGWNPNDKRYSCYPAAPY